MTAPIQIVNCNSVLMKPVFTRRVNVGGRAHVHFYITRENNGFFVWKSECKDTKPWDESEWVHTLLLIQPCVFTTARDELVEKVIDLAREFDATRVPTPEETEAEEGQSLNEGTA